MTSEVATQEPLTYSVKRLGLNRVLQAIRHHHSVAFVIIRSDGKKRKVELFPRTIEPADDFGDVIIRGTLERPWVLWPRGDTPRLHVKIYYVNKHDAELSAPAARDWNWFD